ncbi:MAG: iron ABC transporter permease, partial [Pseudomonadota bacterium]
MRHNLAFILALGVATLAAAPLLVLIVLADDYAAVLSAANFRYLLNTLLLAGLTAAGAVAVGVPLALATAYLRLPFQTLWLVLLASPLAIPSYLGAF